MTCGHCGHQGIHEQVTPPRDTPSVLGGPAYAPLLLCAACGKTFIPREQVAGSEVLACLAEDQQRGARRGGGGSRAKRQPKPGDLLVRRPEQEPAGLIRDRAVTCTRIATRSIVRSVRLTPAEDVLLHQIASIQGVSVGQVLLGALADLAERMGLTA